MIVCRAGRSGDASSPTIRTPSEVVKLTASRTLRNMVTLGGELALVARTFGLGIDAVRDLTVAAMESAFAPDEERRRIVREVIAPGYAALGAGMDVVSEGELRRARAAGVPGSRITFSGVGKTNAEIDAALEAGIFAFNCESEPELALIDSLAHRRGVQARVAGAIVKFVDAAGKPLKTGLAGKLNSEADFVVGYDGRAYLENLTASNAIAIEIEPGSCRAEFAYEARGDDQVVIGPVTCR